MKMTKRIISGVLALATCYSCFCMPAYASELKTDSISVGNCRTDSDLREVDKKYRLLKKVSIKVEGESVYAGKIYGALNYNLIGKDKVSCKVQSNAYIHYAYVSTRKSNAITDDIDKGKVAKTDWVALAGDNGDVGWANFGGGFWVD